MSEDIKIESYIEPSPTHHPPKRLVQVGGDAEGTSYPFFDRLEIGRYRPGREAAGHLLLVDPTVSSRHCILTQDPDGRCFARDVSRNGTRLDGRRLSPNLQTEIQVGQILTIGRQLTFRLEGDQPSDTEVPTSEFSKLTMKVDEVKRLTVLVGDIRNYTVLVQQATSSALQGSVGRLFERLEKEVISLGGTIKEFQGDAIFAFWEEETSENHGASACEAALKLDRLAAELAEVPGFWQVDGFPLHVDWALATGTVVMSGHGEGNAMGLSMVGEPVVLAFRIEKFANEKTGSIIACEETREMASTDFKFHDLGERDVKGFDEPRRLYALIRKSRRFLGR
ncbi:MAG: FHA domain-containing protein [Nitrospirae bacterium]|nr:FHA domain-containing protein [Nitrospirota bacterium]